MLCVLCLCLLCFWYGMFMFCNVSVLLCVGFVMYMFCYVFVMFMLCYVMFLFCHVDVCYVYVLLCFLSLCLCFIMFWFVMFMFGYVSVLLGRWSRLASILEMFCFAVSLFCLLCMHFSVSTITYVKTIFNHIWCACQDKPFQEITQALSCDHNMHHQFANRVAQDKFPEIAFTTKLACVLSRPPYTWLSSTPPPNISIFLPWNWLCASFVFYPSKQNRP